VLVLCSCQQYWHKIGAAKDLNDLQRVQNYWGRISVSGPNWIEDTNQFKVSFNEDPTNYAQAARSNVVGGQASSLESSLVVGQALQGTFAPAISLGKPSASGVSNIPAIPQIPTNAEAALGSSSFAAPFSLLTLQPTPDERQVVDKAINDKIAEQLLELIANPSYNSNLQQVFFGIMQVTCQPGQRTRRGFVADLSVALSYGRECSPGRLEKDSNHHPAVLAVLPLIDSENVQLQQSDRSQVELAQALSLAFAAKGANAAANSLANYVTRQQSDIGTRNSLPIATTYASGATFGFQIYPSLQAITHPGKNGDKSGNVLQPITFPAVVVIRIDKTDLEFDSHKAPVAKWNMIVGNIRTRWIDEKRPALYPIFGHDMYYKTGFPSEASLYEDLYEAKHLDMAHKKLKWLKMNNAEADIPNQLASLESAYDTFKTTSVSLQITENLPANLFSKSGEAGPVIADVYPHLIWRNRDTTFAIVGTNLDGCTYVTIAGIPTATFHVVSSIPAPALGDPAPVPTQVVFATLSAINTFGSLTNATNNIDFVVSGPKGRATKTVALAIQGETTADAVVTLTRDPASSKVTGIDVKHGENLTEQQLLDALQAILQKSEPPPKTVITKP
jgi:hypothetical protein